MCSLNLLDSLKDEVIDEPLETQDVPGSYAKIQPEVGPGSNLGSLGFLFITVGPQEKGMGVFG